MTSVQKSMSGVKSSAPSFHLGVHVKTTAIEMMHKTAVSVSLL